MCCVARVLQVLWGPGAYDQPLHPDPALFGQQLPGPLSIQVMNEEQVALRAYLSSVVSQEQRRRAWLQGQQSARRIELAMSAAQQQLGSDRQEQCGEPELEEGDISHVSISEGKHEADATSTSGTALDMDHSAQEELEVAKAAATLTEMASSTVHQPASDSESEEVLVSPQQVRPSRHTRLGSARAPRASAARSPHTRTGRTMRAGGRLANRPCRATEKYGAQGFWQRLSLADLKGEGHSTIHPGCWWCHGGVRKDFDMQSFSQSTSDQQLCSVGFPMSDAHHAQQSSGSAQGEQQLIVEKEALTRLLTTKHPTKPKMPRDAFAQVAKLVKALGHPVDGTIMDLSFMLQPALVQAKLQKLCRANPKTITGRVYYLRMALSAMGQQELAETYFKASKCK